MPSQRWAQKAFFHTRWGKCEKCGHCDRYEIAAKKGMRLREQKCNGCGALLGRYANTRAVPQVRVAQQVERLARRMGVGWTP